MKVLQKRRESVYKKWNSLTDEINKTKSLSNDTKELIKLAACVVQGSMYGVNIHTKQALERGMPEEQLIDTALCCLPVCGIGYTNQALEAITCTTKIYKREGGKNNE